MVDNGESINVRKEPWLLDDVEGGRVRTRGEEGQEELRVCDFLAPDRLGWDLGMLDITFNRDDVNKI